jgi:hypothetical protein
MSTLINDSISISDLEDNDLVISFYASFDEYDPEVCTRSFAEFKKELIDRLENECYDQSEVDKDNISQVYEAVHYNDEECEYPAVIRYFVIKNNAMLGLAF